MNINGALALGENIGDLGGLAIAHHAYRLYLADNHDGRAPEIDGFSGDQRFFMAWAQVWRNLWTEEGLRSQLINGPHSPPRYRVNGVVRNLDAWYEAFDIGPDDELFLPPEQRVNVW
jgi:putative endopeptidase